MKTKIFTTLSITIAIGAILLGTYLHGDKVVPTLFLWFFGAIILLQAIPALILCCGILRGVSRSSSKAETQLETDGTGGE